MLNDLLKKNLSRRSFLKWSAAVSTPAIVGTGVTGSKLFKAKEVSASEKTKEKIVKTCNTNNCGGRCQIRVHVVDNIITKVSSDVEGNTPENRACIRGRAYRQIAYSPDRLKYPMKRVGKRGEGKFERISWDEAITTIANEITRVKKEYGPEARYVQHGTGHNGGMMWPRNYAFKLLALDGGYLNYYNNYSYGCYFIASPYSVGTIEDGSAFETLLDSKYIILWGNNLMENVFSTPMRYYLRKAKENGTKIVVIDPRCTDTVISLADEWIPILPTTDNALMDAMQYVIITENLQDAEYLNKYTIGFDKTTMPEGLQDQETIKDYILGISDGIPKTPEWAEKICKVPAQKICQLARELATAKPAAILTGYGPQRHAVGEQFVRGAIQLAAITGNIGVRGGWTPGSGLWSRKGPEPGFGTGENPIKDSFPIFLWTDAVERATELTVEDGLRNTDRLKSNIKLIINFGGNMLFNQHSNINRTKKLLEDESKVEFIVCSDLYMTPTAKYADILLPGTSFFERYDIGKPWHFGDYIIFGNKSIDPIFECRNEYDVVADIAEKLGLREEFTEGKTDLDWIKDAIVKAKEKDPNFPSFEELSEKSYHRYTWDQPLVAFEDQIKDPENHKFETPSGKIELFSKDLLDKNNPEEIPAIAKYVPAWEGPSDPLTEKYPLQLIGWHYKRRTHGSHDNLPWLNEAFKQEMWLNDEDAKARNIQDGDTVKVYNDRGVVHIPVKVTPRIIPGVCAMPQGAWYTPDKDNNDVRGCINVLTSSRPTTLGKANPQHTNLVQVEKL